jgi:G3E family GTPase
MRQCLSAREEKTMMEQLSGKQAQRKIPAYVLVGFLGSGKTTVLAQLIEWCVEHDLKPGLIINEFGDISIDGEALRQEGMQMTELSSGCVCCTAGEDMLLSLLDMAARPDIDLIFLEATGLADPADMLGELTDPLLWQQVEVGGILSVIDSWRITGLYEVLELIRHQIDYADVLIMNKCDLIPEEQKVTVQNWLATLAPQARIFPAEHGLPQAGIEAILAQSLTVGRARFQQEVVKEAHPQYDEKHDDHDHEHEHDHDHTHEHEHGHAHASMHSDIFALEQPLDRQAFEQFLEHLPENIYRAKGFVSFADEPDPFLFQYLPGYAHVKRFPLRDRSLLQGVFIGQNLDKSWLHEQLQRCRPQSVVADSSEERRSVDESEKHPLAPSA